MNYGQWQNTEKSLTEQLLKKKNREFCPFSLEIARRDFWEYRKLINPKLQIGWWPQEVAEHLQHFTDDLIAGLKPILMIQAPPQHGKTSTIIDFISWLSGKHPDFRTIYASFSSTLGKKANSKLQRIYNKRIYKLIFPELALPSFKNKLYSCNKEMIEYVDKEGSFRNTTVEGSITGETLDLGVLDDPIRGRKDANSIVKRNTAWDWYTDDFLSRFSENAGFLFILTRWHLDDPAGRLIKVEPPNFKSLKYPAIATKDEKNRKKGEPLFPQFKSLELIKIRKKQYTVSNFEALYQQNPVTMGGEMFKDEWLQFFDTLRRYSRIFLSCDTGFKEKKENDPSVIGVWGVHDKGFDLMHVYRRRAGYPKLKKDCIDIAYAWSTRAELFAGHPLFSIMIEDKASGQSLIQDLRSETNYNIIAINPKGSKEIRAETCTPQFEAGKVFFKKGEPWLEDLLDEVLTFPNSIHDDQVDMISQFLTYMNIPLSGTITDELLEDIDYRPPDNPW